jgi:hypothetical protein
LATILLAYMAIKAFTSPAFTLLRTRVALQHVLEHMLGLWFEFLMIVGATEGIAYTLEMEVVTGLLLMKACVVDGPFFLRWRADVCIEALAMFVDGNVT